MDHISPKSQYQTLVTQDDFRFENDIPLETRHQPTPRHETLQKRATVIQGKKTSGHRIIFRSTAPIVIPMLGLGALALGLVLAHEVQQDPDQSSAGTLLFDQASELDSDSYYVDFNPTTLVTIASWSSTVAPLLTICAMALASYPIVNQLKANSQMAGSDLPTPFQLSMLLETLTGEITALFSLVAYRSWSHTEKITPHVRTVLILLTVFTALGYAIAGVDTWLHLVMEAVNVELADTRVPAEALGRGLPAGPCSNQTADNFDAGECIITSGTNVFLIGANEAARVMGNTSTTNPVHDVIIDGKHMAYLGPAQNPVGPDYRAEALAMYTQCSQIGRHCDLHTEAGSLLPFQCTDAFYGDLGIPNINGEEADGVTGLALRSAGIVFYQDTALTQLANLSSGSGSGESFLTRAANPHYIGVWAKVELPATERQTADGNVVVPGHGGASWILNCSAAAYQIKHDNINGSIQHATAEMANGSVGTILNAANYYGFGKVALETAAYAASQYNDTQKMADSWAMAYSSAAIALSSGIMAGRTDLEEQQRSTKLVSRVPKAPLYTLVCLNTIYAMLGIVLAVLAWRSNPSDTNELRERLSTSGLVAALFEGDRAEKPIDQKREMFAGEIREGGSRREREAWRICV
ncbi:uncharacterized protein Z518_10059 [Rhinocladiella mackenziei CBS 650.93]|uniref:Rhinocladiella mackenziei CBS 650.93 unplaced genomic scaffold supercont1.8, whole genome shotgun sequence n=1 Tax=Rhinocladiella mackenziei CBS 650.93 TaxID=1442369 RepID=A0A0D2GRT6_9EURO|nr:uncharacterized protein Z518_10059 [Rhinocladiella mackenziei CBS 650.93]KIX00993.1 hypothetical protein Z518_10059 [Rhinocladiella mackenziei CBS 650.93]